MREFEYPIEAEYDDHGDEIRPEFNLNVTYAVHGTYSGGKSFEVISAKKKDGGAWVEVEEPELQVLLGDTWADKLGEAAHEDWMEYPNG